jgi:hypothetical protein
VTSDATPTSVTTTTSDPASPPGRASALVRYRCTGCGNLTRFDVVATRRTRAYHHYSLGGDLSVEDVDVLDETVEEVSCRWCGHGNAVEVVEDAAG